MMIDERRGGVVRPEGSGRTTRAKLRDQLTGALFVTPITLGFLLFVLFPLVCVIYFSFFRIDLLSGEFIFVGVENFARLFTLDFLGVAINTALFAGGVVPLNVIVGLGLAVLVNERLLGIGVIRGLFFLPVVISLVAWSLIWRYILQNDGGLNSLLALVGLDGPNWLYDANFAMPAMIIVQVIKGVGLSMVFFLAALQSIGPEYYESARMDGANAWSRFTNITVPLVSPTILLVAMLVTAGSLKTFAQILVLTNGGPQGATTTLGIYIYKQAFEFFDTGYASALAIVLFLITAALMGIQWLARKKWVFLEN